MVPWDVYVMCFFALFGFPIAIISAELWRKYVLKDTSKRDLLGRIIK